MAANSNEFLTLIDSEENQSYVIQVSTEEAKRAKNDLQFATLLLNRAKLYNNTTDDSIGHVNLNLEDISISEDTTDNSNFNEINEKNKDQHNWSTEETLLLLDISTNKEKEFHSSKCTVKHCRKNVSKEMKNVGHNISGEKCSIKFQALKKTYKAIKDHNNQSGNNTNKWEYFDIMDEIFSKKPWIQPLSVAGTSVDISATSSGEENDQSSNISTSKRKSKIEKYMETLVAEKKLKRKSTEKRHQEKMEQLKKLENLLEKVIQENK